MRTFRSVGFYGLAMCLALVMVASGGCKGKKPVAVNPDLGSTASTTGTESTANPNELPTLDENTIFGTAQGLQTVYFDYDSFALRADAREMLKGNADKIKQVQRVMIQLAGHCDERGTQEYNLALGERRALAVRDYLIQLGVSGDRLATISYGEEAPADPGQNESAWAQNRRVEFKRAM